MQWLAQISVRRPVFATVLMLVIGLMIGLVVVLLYLPIFQLAESLG